MTAVVADPGVIAAQTIDLGGINTRYFEAGAGDPMVFWHGDSMPGSANANTWDLNLGPLSRDFHVLAADRLGMGFTDNPRTDADYTMEATIEHAASFLKAKGLTGIHMVGQSFGAYVAARLTLEYPELVRTLTLIDSASLAPETGDADPAMPGLLAGGPKDPREYAYYRWATQSYSSAHITDHYLNDAGEAGLLPKRSVALEKMAALRASQFQPSVKKQKGETLAWLAEGRLTMPVLVVWGYNDRTATLSAGLELFSMIVPHAARAQLHVFNQACHYPYREHCADFNDLITAFVKHS